MLIRIIVGLVALALYGAGAAVTMGAATAYLEQRGYFADSRWAGALLVAVAIAWPVMWLGVALYIILRMMWDLVCWGFLALVELGYRRASE